MDPVAAAWCDDSWWGRGRAPKILHMAPRGILTWLPHVSPSCRLTSLMPQRWTTSPQLQPLPTRQLQQPSPANREHNFHLVGYVTNRQGQQFCVSLKDMRLDPVSFCTPSCGYVSITENAILKSTCHRPDRVGSAGSWVPGSGVPPCFVLIPTFSASCVLSSAREGFFIS